MDKKINVNEISPLPLAYLGDAVFEYKIRSHAIGMYNLPVNGLHNFVKDYVNASGQSIMFEYIFDKVSDDEQKILLKGRNAKPHSKAKSATIKEYKYATGIEFLFGYLEYTDQKTRINEIFDLCLEAIDEFAKGNI